MSFFEFYRLGIPMLLPSKDLLVDWIGKYGLLWERVYGHPKRLLETITDVPDPNDESSTSVRFWLKFADFYVFPHLVYFSSWEDLVHKLQTVDFHDVSARMKQHSSTEREDLIRKWAAIFSKLKSSLHESLNHEGNRKFLPLVHKAL
jgi:hypothetical protein